MPQDENISAPQKDDFARYFTSLTDSEANSALLLSQAGVLRVVNRTARQKFPQLKPGTDLIQFCDDPDRLRNYLSQCAGTRGPLPGAFAFALAGGDRVRWRCDGGLVTPAGNGAPAQIVLRLRPARDAHRGFLQLSEKVTTLSTILHRQEQTQYELERALAAKQVLLAEVQHRIKNNLQIVLSMLSFAAKAAPDPNSRLTLAETSNRVHAMATVHGLLYESSNFKDIDCAQLIAMLAGATEQTYGRDEVRVKVCAEPLRIGSDDALSLALIVTELVSNAFKHAFPEGRSGTVTIRLLRDEQKRVVVSVSDDGVDFRASCSGTGLSLVRALAEKLGGELKIAPTPVKSFSIAFAGDGSGSGKDAVE